MSSATSSQLELVDQLRAAVMQKAGSDPAFRAELLANPKAAVEKLTGAALPAGHAVQVLAETPTSWALVLPHETHVGAGGELSDSDLESVAGGSKDDANRFFNNIGNAFKIAPVLAASTVGSVIPVVGMVASVGCGIGSAASGHF